MYSQKSQDNDVFTVVLDAGHGGKDSGNRGNQYYEKHIALNVTLKIGAILKSNPEIKIIYTRKSDVFIPLNKRADIANSAKASLVPDDGGGPKTSILIFGNDGSTSYQVL